MHAQKNQLAQKPVSIKLDASLKARLDAVAAFKDRTPHWLMQEAITTYVQREERQASMWRDAVNAYEDFELTGLHLDQATADAWLAEIASGNDIEPPEWQS